MKNELSILLTLFYKKTNEQKTIKQIKKELLNFSH